MGKYKCPKCDYKQKKPGMCPNHNIDLIEERDEEVSMDEDIEDENI